MPKRSYADRRSGKDRRKRLALNRFFYRGPERRGQQERRSQAERRAGWIRISTWASANIQKLKFEESLD